MHTCIALIPFLAFPYREFHPPMPNVKRRKNDSEFDTSNANASFISIMPLPSIFISRPVCSDTVHAYSGFNGHASRMFSVYQQWTLWQNVQCGWDLIFLLSNWCLLFSNMMPLSARKKFNLIFYFNFVFR